MIIPALLEYDTRILDEKIRLALAFADTIHIDIVDYTVGQRSNIIEPEFFRPYTAQAFFELHMMVDNPSSYVKAFAQAGFKRFIGHVEHIHNSGEFIRKAHHHKTEAFLGIDLLTPLEKALTFPVEHSGLHGVTILTVKAGQSGQPFNPTPLEKITSLHKRYPHLKIEVDGGMNEHTIPQAKHAGAHQFAVTSALFNSIDPSASYTHLRSLID